MTAYSFQRVLLKLSGELLMGNRAHGIDPDAVQSLAQDIADVYNSGVEIAVVVGGGNIFRGAEGVAQGIDQGSSDNMGMLATVMNALALSSVLQRMNISARVMSALPMDVVCESYVRHLALRHMSRGRLLILAGGTGTPYFSTDTAAALRAAELKCQVMLKGTKVSGVFAQDPIQHPDAHHFPRITYSQVLGDYLKVMDASAVALARETGMPILVFRIQDRGAFSRVLAGKGVYTQICESFDTEK